MKVCGWRCRGVKKQDPVLIIEPMLEALNKPENFLASRIHDVLQALGPKLVPVILQKIEQADINGKIVMVQLLGAFGDSSVIPALTELLDTQNYLLKKMTVEAIGQIQGEEVCPVLMKLLQDENCRFACWRQRQLAEAAIIRPALPCGRRLPRAGRAGERNYGRNFMHIRR